VASAGHATSTCGVRELRAAPVRRSVRQQAAAWRPTSIVCCWRCVHGAFAGASDGRERPPPWIAQRNLASLTFLLAYTRARGRCRRRARRSCSTAPRSNKSVAGGSPSCSLWISDRALDPLAWRRRGARGASRETRRLLTNRLAQALSTKSPNPKNVYASAIGLCQDSIIMQSRKPSNSDFCRSFNM